MKEATMGVLRVVASVAEQALIQANQQLAMNMGFEEGYNGDPPRIIDIPIAPPTARYQAFYSQGYQMGQQRAMIDKIQGTTTAFLPIS